MPAYSRILLPWDSQPQEVVGVDYNGIGRGIQHVHVGNDVSGWENVNGAGTRITSAGVGKDFVSGSSQYLKAPAKVKNYPLTFACLAVKDGALDYAYMSIGAGTQRHMMYRASGDKLAMFSGAGGTTAQAAGAKTLANGTLYALVGTVNAANERNVYVDGVLDGTNTTTVSTTDADIAVIGQYWNNNAPTASYYFDGAIPLGVMWDRALSADEVREWSRNPWQIFTPRSIWIPVSAGGGGVSGTLATTNANDTSSAAGTTTIVGTLARTNANDTSAASGTTTVLGTLARTNANDTSAASGTTTILGTVAATNTDDTCAASGTVGSSGTTGTVAYTNADDTAAATGTTTVTGTVARSNADDSVSASGWVGAITGTLNVTNANDTAQASGTAAGGVQTGGGGYLPSFRRKTRKEIHAERVRLGILPEEIRKAAQKVVEKAAEQGDPQEVYEDNTERYRTMFLREIGATKWAPDYARAIRIQLELMESDAEDALLLM